MMIDKVSVVTSLSPTQHFGRKSAEDKGTAGEKAVEAAPPVAAESEPESVGDSSVKNAEFAVGGMSVSFEMDREINRVVVTVTDKESGEVIRQIPAEEARALAKQLAESSGKLLDKIV